MDLHVHTVLSACADQEMLPPLIVARALELGLRAIAVTDHNSADNAQAVIEAASQFSLVVFPGMELQTREEVHLLAIFDDVTSALALADEVESALPAEPNRPDFFGEQLVVNADGRVIGSNDRLLQTSTCYSVDEAVRLVKQLGGLCLAAHVDRPSFSIIGSLGFIPPDLPLDGVGLSRLADPARVVAGNNDLSRFGMGCFGDAHRLSEMTARTSFLVEAASVAELRMAFQRHAGREIHIGVADHDQDVQRRADV